jgi:hypothetical protein
MQTSATRARRVQPLTWSIQLVFACFCLPFQPIKKPVPGPVKARNRRVAVAATGRMMMLILPAGMMRYPEL